MKDLKKLLRNVMAIALIVTITVPSSIFAFADTVEVNAKITSNMLVAMNSNGGASYTDGTYTGKGNGRNGDITVEVTITDGNISNIDVEQQETTSYWEKAKELIDTIKNMGNPSANDIDAVDAITTATLSSDGIKEAMKAALATALADETIFASGEGTAQSPYIISNKIQLQNFANSVNSGEEYADKHIKLSNDIDLSEIAWTPIGSEDYAFGGYFDGNGKNVTNLTIGGADSYVTMNKAGFFGKLSDGASVKNLTIDNAEIYAVAEAGEKAYGAGIAAVSAKNNSIDKCQVIDSEIHITSDDQQFVYAAGLVGYLDQNSSVTNSIFDGNIKGESGNSVYAGGISGLTGNKTLMMNNSIGGSVEAEVISGGKATATAVGGGLVGMASGVAYNCYADNTVSVTNNTTDTKLYKGSLVAWSTANGCVINCCYNNALNGAEPVVMYPTGSTFFEGLVDIKEKTQQDIVDILHNNLSSSSITSAKSLMAEKAPSKDFGFEGNLTDKVFYDWEVLNSKASLSEKVWKENFNPSNIFASGEGTESAPYIIETDEQIRKFATSMSDKNTYAGKFIKLVNNLDVSDKNWTPIGEGEYPFCGNFDGDNHIIEGITIKAQDGNAYNAGNDVYFGLFGVIGQNGIVKSLGITNADINVYGKASVVVGGICGLNDRGTIDSCSVTGILKGQTTEKGNNYIGGIAGWAIKGYIVNSYTNADVYSSVLPTALAMSGGLVGMTNRSVVANCYSLGTTTGHTKRELEVVESMAAVGGLVGVAGSPVVNCYTAADTISEDYSYYVGATIGWATGISEVYDVYYNTEANQTIQNEKVSPVSEIGWLVGPGINEEGEVYAGAMTYNNEGLSAEVVKSQALADKLNANFNAFPLNTNSLPATIQLKKWSVQDGVVTFSDEYATRTYVEPDIEKPTLTGNYYDGIYFGRAKNGTENSYVTVTMEIKDKKIISIKCDTEIEGTDSVIETVLKSNAAPDVKSSDSTSMTVFKNALRRATVKALKGDYTDYKTVETSIFEGGAGSKDNPYKISTANQLIKFAASINEVEHFKDKYIILTNNIDLSGIQWVPAGGSGLYSFSGYFDGKGYAISNLKIGSSDVPERYTCAGLFAHTDMATISNLKVQDAYIHIKPSSIPGISSEKTYAGMIVGYAGLTNTTGTRGTVIDNCYVTGQIISNSVESNYVGGFAGTLVHSLLSNSYSNCELEAISPGNWVYTGGIVGLPAFSILVNNVAYGKIHSDGTVNKTQLGGIGGMYSSYAFNNYTDVNLQAERQTPDIGGIAGRITGVGYISSCYGNMITEQKSGNKVVTGINTVGTIVNGDRYGKGKIEKSELVAAIDQTLVNLLNQNLSSIGKDSMYTELVREWSVYIPEKLTYNAWEIKDGKVVFAASQSETSGGSSSSGGRSSSSTTTNATTGTTDYKVKSVVSQGSASAQIKVNNIKESKTLQIESSIANIVFDEKAIKAILSNAGSEVTTKINTIEKSSLSKEVQDIVGDRPVYDITLTSGEKTISDFGTGTVRVEIPYTLREGEDPDRIIVYYMDNQGKLTQMATTYNKNTKMVTFKTNHFSKYIVGYDAKTATSSTFTDIAENAWYTEAVQYVFKNDIMSGVSDVTFDPNANSTRAMVCTILWNMEKKPTQTADSGFADVSSNSWYAQSVVWANQQGITKGVGENSFAPNEKVTREQFAQFLYSYAKYKGYSVDQTKELSEYKDKPSAWAENAVKWAVGNQIMSGKGNGVLDPQGTATRAEIAQMIMKFNEK